MAFQANSQQDHAADAIAITLILVILGIILLFATCIGAFVIAGRLEIVTACGINHEAYQTIEANAAQWAEIFKTGMESVIRFSVPSGNQYVAVDRSYSSESAEGYFFVKIVSSRNDSEGAAGFYYSSIGKPTINALYQVEPLVGNIYCYHYG